MHTPISTLSLSVAGMHCEGCVNSVKRLILKQDSQAQVDVDFKTSRVTILTDKPLILFSDALTKAGYPTQPQSMTDAFDKIEDLKQ
jgi:copper chaperone